MFRKAAVLAICSVFVLLGCEKKEPQEGGPALTRRPSVEPLAGMAAIREGVPIFISRESVSIAQYVECLRATGQPVPGRWERIQPGAPGADQPVTGLTGQEAGGYATWDMKRLPTPEEWKLAASIVGAGPYPWPEGEPAPGELFLVQDWLPGTEGERLAQQRRAELAETILAQCSVEIAELRGRLTDQIRKQRMRRAEQRNQLVPAFFALLDKEKNLVELRARRERRAEVLEILRQIALEKGTLAATLRTSDISAEGADAAAQDYEKHLADVRSKIQDVRQELQSATQKLQDEVVALTKAFQETGTTEVQAQLAAAEAALTESSAEITDIQQAAGLRFMLQSALQGLEKAPPALAGLPTADEIKERIAQIDEQVRELAGQDRTSAQIEDIRQSIGHFSDAIKREFLQEKLLFDELDELVELRARREAAEARIRGLKKVLQQAPAVSAG